MKKYILGIVFIFLGAICFIVYKIKGSTVEPDGTLAEPFWLIPLSYIFTFIGFILLAYVLYKRSKNR